MVVGEREEDLINERSVSSCGVASVEGADRRNGVAADLFVVEVYWYMVVVVVVGS